MKTVPFGRTGGGALAPYEETGVPKDTGSESLLNRDEAFGDMNDWLPFGGEMTILVDGYKEVAVEKKAFVNDEQVLLVFQIDLSLQAWRKTAVGEAARTLQT